MLKVKRKRAYFRIQETQEVFQEELDTITRVNVLNLEAKRDQSSTSIVIEKHFVKGDNDSIGTILQISLPFQELVEEACFSLSANKPLGEIYFPHRQPAILPNTEEKCDKPEDEIEEIPPKSIEKQEVCEKPTFSISGAPSFSEGINACEEKTTVKNEERMPVFSEPLVFKKSEEEISQKTKRKMPKLSFPEIDWKKINQAKNSFLKQAQSKCSFFAQFWKQKVEKGKAFSKRNLKNKKLVVLKFSPPKSEREVMEEIDPEKIKLRKIVTRSVDQKNQIRQKMFPLFRWIFLFAVLIFCGCFEIQTVKKEFNHFSFSNVGCQILLSVGDYERAVTFYPENKPIIQKKLNQKIKNTQTKDEKQELQKQKLLIHKNRK